MICASRSNLFGCGTYFDPLESRSASTVDDSEFAIFDSKAEPAALAKASSSQVHYSGNIYGYFFDQFTHCQSLANNGEYHHYIGYDQK